MKSLKTIAVACLLAFGGASFAADKLEPKTAKLEPTKGTLFLHDWQQVVEIDREIASTEKTLKALQELRVQFQAKVDAIVKPATTAAKFDAAARVTFKVDDEGLVWLAEVLDPPAPVGSAVPDKK